MYSGRAARSHFNTAGGVINYQCFPDDPEYDKFGTGGRRAKIYGVEYEDPIDAVGDLDDHNVPCAVCYVPTRPTSLMIPAKLTCPTGWTEEYNGWVHIMNLPLLLLLNVWIAILSQFLEVVVTKMVEYSFKLR